jgi:hypothetical protein
VPSRQVVNEGQFTLYSLSWRITNARPQSSHYLNVEIVLSPLSSPMKRTAKVEAAEQALKQGGRGASVTHPRE